MKIRTEDIKEAEKEAEFVEEIDTVNEALALSKAVDYQFRAPIGVKLGYYRAGSDLFFHGQISGSVAATCARCLEGFRSTFERPFAFLMKSAEGNLEAPEERESSLAFYRGEEVDLSPLIHEEMMLSLPTRALCNESCAGLCPRCGANRNLAPCECRDEWVDPRLSSLKSLKLRGS